MSKTRIVKREGYFYPEYFTETIIRKFWIFSWTTPQRWHPFLIEYDGLFDDLDIASFSTLEDAQYFLENGKAPAVSSSDKVVWESN